MFTNRNGDFGLIFITERSDGQSNIGQVFMLYWIAFRVSTESYPVQGPRSGFISGRGGGGGCKSVSVRKLRGTGACSPGKISNLSLLKWL